MFDAYNIYCYLKTHLRHEIILNIKKKYSKNTILVGNNWKKYFDDSLDTTYNLYAEVCTQSKLYIEIFENFQEKL